MRNVYCENCGILTAKLEKGSSIHPKAVMLCDGCYEVMKPVKSTPNPFDKYDSGMFGEKGMDYLKSMFGMK
jgi:hypothetical protein